MIYINDSTPYYVCDVCFVKYYRVLFIYIIMYDSVIHLLLFTSLYSLLWRKTFPLYYSTPISRNICINNFNKIHKYR